MSETVLLPTTGRNRWDRKAADVIAEMEHPGNSVVLLHEFSREEAESLLPRSIMSDNFTALNELARERIEVTTIESILSEADLTLSTRGMLERDNQTEAIMEGIENEGIDRVYMYCRRRSPTGKAVFGSILQKTIMQVSTPVVVIPPNIDDW